MLIETALAFAGGVAWGYFLRWEQTRHKARPIRLLKVGMIAPGMPAIQSIIDQEWRTNMQAFTLYAEWSGISEQAVVNAGICSSRGYRRYVAVLKDAGILVAYARSRTHYAPGWCPAKVRSFIRRQKLSLPYPAQPPPIIHPPGQSGRRFYS